jgi:RNA polymerase sigma factor (TIGR02999 family)
VIQVSRIDSREAKPAKLIDPNRIATSQQTGVNLDTDGGVSRLSDVTTILAQIQSGDASSAEELLEIVYDELRKLATARLIQEKPGQTLQATALVHEAYLRLVGSDSAQTWANRAHFFAAAAESMRRILIEQARRKASEKRGGGMHRVPLGDLLPASIGRLDSESDIFALNDALDELETMDSAKAQIFKLHFFVGLSLIEAAEAIGVSHATARRHWIYAKSWLYGKLRDQ